MIDLFLINMQLFTSQDINWWTGVMWIACGLLWCFYQLFTALFWRHPFTAEDPLVSKLCNAKFLQICSGEETSSSTSRLAWGRVFSFLFICSSKNFTPFLDDVASLYDFLLQNTKEDILKNFVYFLGVQNTTGTQWRSLYWHFLKYTFPLLFWTPLDTQKKLKHFSRISSAEHKRYFEEFFNIFVYTMHVNGVQNNKGPHWLLLYWHFLKCIFILTVFGWTIYLFIQWASWVDRKKICYFVSSNFN